MPRLRRRSRTVQRWVVCFEDGPTAAQVAVAALPRVGVTNGALGTSDTCAVCLGTFQTEDVGIVLRCRHGYHEGCIVPWLCSRGTCPVCRSQEVRTTTRESAWGSIARGLISSSRRAAVPNSDSPERPRQRRRRAEEQASDPPLDRV